VTVSFELICLIGKLLFDVEFLYVNVIYYSIYISLISSFAVIPKKRVMMWIFYPLIVLLMAVNFYAPFWYMLKIPSYTNTYKSPRNINTLFIGNYVVIYFGGVYEYSFYKSTGIFFKKKLCENVSVSSYKISFDKKLSENVSGTETGIFLELDTLRWIDDYTVSIKSWSNSTGKLSDFKIDLR
jgi:hypothetical protein